MKTKVRLNCYFFSNLIVGLLSLNMLFNDETSALVATSNTEGQLEAIYAFPEVLEDEEEEVVEIPKTTTTNVTQKNPTNYKAIPYVKPSYNAVTGSNLVNYAKHYLGLRYVSGGNSLETGTDCSGFTKLIFKEFGINLGRSVDSQLYSGTYVSKSDLQPGDLVFYGYSNYYASHVAIYIGGGMIIHASNPRDGVKISSVNIMQYITARRLITANVGAEQEKKPEENLPADEENKENTDTQAKDENIKDNDDNNSDTNNKVDEGLSDNDTGEKVPDKEENKENKGESSKENLPSTEETPPSDSETSSSDAIQENGTYQEENANNSDDTNIDK